MHPILETAAKEKPGEYLSNELLNKIHSDEPFMSPRLKAFANARDNEKIIVENAVSPTLKKFPFETKIPNSREKCHRDVSYVYRYAAFAMLLDNMDFLDNKLLFWLRTILHSQNFPGGIEPCKLTYKNLRLEVDKKLPPDSSKLLIPYFARCEEILTLEKVPIE